MLHSNTDVYLFKIALVASLVLACFCWAAPGWRMPINIHAVLWWSVPLACLWLLTVGVSAFRFGRKTLWMLFGVPPALYWPVWLVLNGIPACYWYAKCA
jgi:hypothetical protein